MLALLTIALQRGIAQPLRALTAATERIAAGDLDQPLRPANAEELARLATTFNEMMVRIRARETEIQRQQGALHQSEKLAAMGSLLAGVAHELNNPLFVVSGRAMMLESAAAGTPYQVAAQKIRGAAERCARIVRTFLAMARQDQPRHGLLRIDEVLRSCVDILEYTLRTNGVQVKIDAPARVPEVFGDADQLHQVLMNLFVNAQQAMADVHGPRVLRVAIRDLQAEARVEVRVSDSGPGVPPDIRQRIFDPFFTTKPVGLRMPDMDGVELYHEIAARWPALAQRIAFITGDGLTAMNSEHLIALDRPVIEKPFSADDLYAVIDALDPNG